MKSFLLSGLNKPVKKPSCKSDEQTCTYVQHITNTALLTLSSFRVCRVNKCGLSSPLANVEKFIPSSNSPVRFASQSLGYQPIRAQYYTNWPTTGLITPEEAKRRSVKLAKKLGCPVDQGGVDTHRDTLKVTHETWDTQKYFEGDTWDTQTDNTCLFPVQLSTLK